MPDRSEHLPTPADIRRVIPSTCFEASLPRSLYYVVRSIGAGITLAILYLLISEHLRAALGSTLGALVQPFLFGGYAFTQGLVLFSLFLIGHDCAHGAFSRYPLLNQIVGNLVQGLVLVPHMPWRMSHAHHHKNTNNIDEDEGFGPLRQRWATEREARWALRGYLGLGLSFFVYFWVGTRPHSRCHLRPWEPFFRSRLGACAVSVILYGVQAAVVLALLLSGARGMMLRLYIAPMLVFGSCAVLVFFSHHNDHRTRWYGRRTWRRDLVSSTGTVDRTWGQFLDNVVLHITYHQVHHIFPIIPHYHLRAATTAFRAAFPHLANFSDESFLRASLRNLLMFQRRGRVPDDVQIVSLFDP